MMRPFRSELIPPPPPPPLTPLWPSLDDFFGGRDHLVDLEIGAGAGLHAIQYGHLYPERLLIAIERTKKFDRMQRRLGAHQQIKNILPVRADAVTWVTWRVPLESLNRIFILYPNPYPKGRHKNQRWPFMPFMGFLISRLKLGGEIVLATNLEWYRDECRRHMVELWGLELESCDLLLLENFVPRTHFEKKYLKRGERCWNLVFRKTSYRS